MLTLRSGRLVKEYNCYYPPQKTGVVDSEIKNDSFTSTVHVPSGFYIMLAPSNKLIQLIEVGMVTTIKKY